MPVVPMIASAVIGNVVGNIMGGGGGSSASQGQQAQQMVDPFSPYRAGYGQQLNELMANPASVQSLPGYQAMMQQGMQQIQRQAAATGQTQSGAELLALQNQGSLLQNQFYQQQLQNLMALSGASSSPAAGGQIGVQAAQQAGAQQGQLLGAIPGLLNQVGSLFGTQTSQNTMVDTLSQAAAAQGNTYW